DKSTAPAPILGDQQYPPVADMFVTLPGRGMAAVVRCAACRQLGGEQFKPRDLFQVPPARYAEPILAEAWHEIQPAAERQPGEAHRGRSCACATLNFTSPRREKSRRSRPRGNWPKDKKACPTAGLLWLILVDACPAPCR